MARRKAANPQEDMLRRMEEIYNRITKRNEQFSTLYLETVPRSFVQITHEEEAKRPQGDEPWTVYDHVTQSESPSNGRIAGWVVGAHSLWFVSKADWQTQY